MPDIFISYSRKDSELALRLASFLSLCGHSVWIDENKLEAATLWTSEIVRAISECQAFILLLTPNSIGSPNVVKELALASEKRKHILPIRVKRVTIPDTMQYPLAGIQHVPFGENEALLNALAHLGLTQSKKEPINNRIARTIQSRISIRLWAISYTGVIVLSVFVYFQFLRPGKSSELSPVVAAPVATLMIMPLEDFSRSHNLQWFADGLVSELVETLSSIQGIRMVDQSTSFSYRGIPSKSSELVKELHVRYFLEGSIRSAGRQLRIVLQLFDYDKGIYLWKKDFEGSVNQVFRIQESIARNVLEGMQVFLSLDEDYRLATRGLPRFSPRMSP